MAMLTAPPALIIPPKTFCFQPRCLAMDRHRLSAVDVERVAREGDVAVLQEHISNITFCNMDAERCPHCRQPADPVLLTVLRLAQLSIEYLLHCQQHLADSLAVHAQHLQDARAQLAHAQGLASEQATRLRGEKEESRRWKKLVATQLLLQARPSGYYKEEKRAHQREVEERRDFERWKEEERMKLHMEMDGLRQRFFTELQDAASRSSAMEGKLEELQAKAAVVSNLGTLQDDDSELEMTAVQTKLLSANKPKVTQQVTRAVVSEESLEGNTADDAQSGKKWLLEALWRKPNLLKKFRHILEETLEERLESMGISRAAKGISSQTYQHLQAVLRLQQLQKAKNSPGLLHLRDELIQMVMKRVKQLKKPSIPLPRQLSIIPGTAVSIKGKPLERHLDVKTQRPASGMKSHP
ncbi:cilium assembly protein DZIP1L isoform X2 [Tympanuchus pallidicinctus]|uniref:cilium assembly protein DZIP1L isoform X2 n=1 Tax=Tympanuchus pallidicinctus TaxID=109042 RepID=UPI0022874A49|nr:cilium assembly protein DZIP1L isoform X2 [Tympanuchus pallidicinctus]